MAQWLNKMKAFAEDAADSTSRAAQRAKLEAEIQYLERQIRLCKEKFGVAIWDIFTTDKAKVDAEYAAHSKEVEGFLADITTKRMAIEQLKVGASEVESAASAPPDERSNVKKETTSFASGAVAPSPPPPSAGRVAGQWAEYADSTGKLYYHNSTTDSTQWNAPPEFSGAKQEDSRTVGGYPVGAQPAASRGDIGSSSGGAGMWASVFTAASSVGIVSALASTARTSEPGAPGARGSAPLPGGNTATIVDPGGLASVLTAVAGVAAATGTTQDVAKAAAPHVAAAAHQRYTGENGIEKLSSDASTIASIGSAVANNPAARALGSAILAGVLNSATVPPSNSASAAPPKR